MKTKARNPVIVVGGGPAGSVAALCLRELGRDVVVFEREKFPRYRLGESLLPGTMSILNRLGVMDRVEAANFVKKSAATFIWGPEQAPWTFTFATPRTAPWVYDHAYQVTRAEYDQILLDAARERGADVREEHEVTDIRVGADGGPVSVAWRNNGSTGALEGDFVIDASGTRGIVARKLGLRRFDRYFQNLAVWSYFRGGKRFGGDLEGNIFSVTCQEGWIWIIPLKDDIYSVGVVSDKTSSARMREIGIEAFYRESLARCRLARDVLNAAERCDKVRVIRDWAYDASSVAMGRAFLCGDSACFIDPLFSQGVHLATYSAMLASAGIDHLYRRPGDADEIRTWYEKSYREAYNRYHEFLAAFYSANSELPSDFWQSRQIAGAADRRFAGKEWFTALAGQHVEGHAEGVEDLEARASTLAHLWQHNRNQVDDEFDETELSLRRLRWASRMMQDFRRMNRITWVSNEVRLVPSFKVHPTSFRLERQFFVGDEHGQTMAAYPLSEDHRELFESLKHHPLSYRQLAGRVKALGGPGTPIQIIGRLTEMGFLQGSDSNGEPVKIRAALRFGGVGAEDDIS
ncbi:MAG: NAD(P)/FAD-dependent oxidoreductase [Gemmatimonadetes bacterium]|nr:NAD(P)/FAD-dependent oxidoreductase [Gemmatimonadota bacterium]